MFLLRQFLWFWIDCLLNIREKKNQSRKPVLTECLSFKMSVTYKKKKNFTPDNRVSCEALSSDISQFFAGHCLMSGANIQAWLVSSTFPSNELLVSKQTFRVLTSPSGLPFNDIFPIVSQLEFPNFCKLHYFEKPAHKPIIGNLEHRNFFSAWLGDGCCGNALVRTKLCENYVVQNNLEIKCKQGKHGNEYSRLPLKADSKVWDNFWYLKAL